MGVGEEGKMSLDFCGAYHLVPVKEDTGGFRIVLQKIE